MHDTAADIFTFWLICRSPRRNSEQNQEPYNYSTSYTSGYATPQTSYPDQMPQMGFPDQYALMNYPASGWLMHPPWLLQHPYAYFPQNQVRSACQGLFKKATEVRVSEFLVLLLEFFQASDVDLVTSTGAIASASICIPW